MGSDISLRRRQEPFEDHPDWQRERLVGDTQFAGLEPRIDRPFYDDYLCDSEWLFRPADFAFWRAALDDENGMFAKLHRELNEGGSENLRRFHSMLDAMEADPDLWGWYGQ